MQATDLALLLDAAESAARIGTRYFKASPEIWDKGDGQGPVTEADLEIDRMLKAELRSARPDYGWLSEETEDNTDRQHAEHVFIIDPIDGTRAFIDGQKSWCHSLAIAHHGKVTAAVVHLPMREEVFSAEAGQGAHLNGTRLAAEGKPDPSGADVLTTRPTLDPKHWKDGQPPGFTRQFRPSLAFRMCLVAQSRFDAMITLRNAWEWDIAAGDLICREAGASVSDRLGGDLVFNAPSAKQAGVLAANPPLHQRLMLALEA